MAFLEQAANRGSVSTGAYEIENSCYFDSASSHNMYFNPGSTSSTAERKKGTISFWIKRTKIDAGMRVFHFGQTVDSYAQRLWIRFNADNTMHFYPILTMTTEYPFKDVSAWYHIVWMFDTTQPEQDDNSSSDTNHAQDPSTNPEGGSGTAQCGLWINGVRMGNDNGLPHDNTAGRTSGAASGWGWTTADKHAIGYDYLDNTGYGDFYLAEFHAIQGLAVQDPDDFGEFNDDGVWVPKKYTGTAYGTNGFYLKFNDSSNMGDDSSSEGNNFTLVNMGSDNQMTDTPTNNFNVLNINDKAHGTGWDATVSKGNLQVTGTNGDYNMIHSSMAAGAGKWYCEAKVVAVGNRTTHWVIGHSDAAWSFKDSTHVWGAGDGAEDMHDLAWSWFSANDLYNGTWDDSSPITSSGTTAANGDIYMIATDYDNGKAWFGKNGTWFNATGTSNPATGAYPHISNLLTRATDDGQTTSMIRTGFAYYNDDTNSRTYQVNFGNPIYSISSGNADANGYGNFEYAPPSGFYAWCSKNLAEYG